MMIMPVALLLVKLVLIDRMVSMYRVCRWFGYLLLSVFWVLESFSLRPRQLVHCPAFINKKQGEREFTWRQQRLLLFFFAKSAAPVTTSFPRQFAGKTQHRQLLLTQGS